MSQRAPAPTAAESLAAFCADLRWDALPAPVRDRTKELLLDLFGVALRGSLAASSAAALAAARRLGSAGEASLIGAGSCTSAPWAALANGTAAHAIEMDDVTSRSSLHPGAAVIPASLAVAQERRASPAALLEAIVAGYEVAMRVGDALNAASAYRRGFHPTGVAGVFGTAVAAGRLVGLDRTGLARALGVAGTLASGSLEYLSDGAWTKRLNPGWAAHAGIVAAALAAEGFVSPRTVFEGRLGVLRAYTDEPREELLTAALGESYAVMTVSIKPYACCRYNHALIDGALALAQAHRVRPEEVERVRLGILSGGALLVSEPIEEKLAPRNVVDAQFSAPFAAAVALVRGSAGFADYTQANVEDPSIRSLMSRTECFRDPSLDAVYPDHWPATVELVLRDGRALSIRIDDASGEPGNPVSPAGLRAKFCDLASGALGTEALDELAERTLALDAEADLRRVGALLRGPARPE